VAKATPRAAGEGWTRIVLRRCWRRVIGKLSAREKRTQLRRADAPTARFGRSTLRPQCLAPIGAPAAKLAATARHRLAQSGPHTATAERVAPPLRADSGRIP